MAKSTQSTLCYTKFINTMKQEPVVEQLLPLPAAKTQADAGNHNWDYIYEPDAATVIDELLERYVEALVYQSVAENLASEQSARMVGDEGCKRQRWQRDRRIEADLQQNPPSWRLPKNFPKSSPVRLRFKRIKLYRRNEHG